MKSKVEEILFEAALALSPAERAAYLDKACHQDAQLRGRVEALLQAHERAGDFMAESAAPTSAGTVRISLPLTEKPGDKIGHYKLLQQIGEGGCGVVYMAEQEEPIRRRVAFKVIKLGMDTKQVIARFEAERQALALMDHPNIAKVLDAGATDTGRPYFVMELVRGIRITDYCDQNKLSTEDRLNLFIQVCHAIQHAHQKGIIHRDIKPSNILVTVNDGVPVPKVIDFGIAKATGGQLLTDKTLFTAFEQFVGTPAYMSPEQAEMTSLDIDTRSDIYALGVLLYELLTGQTPFDAKTLMSAGLDGMRRIIREKEPPRPSTRLSTLDEAEQTTVASRRQTELPKLMHQVRGDLDWIVMKCLEKDRTRRYETANGLANDILRHLNSEPVAACPPSRVYQFQKLLRRNKLWFTAVGAVAGALVIGLGLSTWLFLREREALRAQRLLRQQAQLEQRKAQIAGNKSQQVAQFLRDMLKSVDPSVALGRDATMLKEILDKTAERVGRDLTKQPEVEAELRSILGNTYKELGEYPKAVEMHRQALKLRQALYGGTHELVAAALYDLGNTLGDSELPEDMQEAESNLRKALEIRRHLPGPPMADVALSLTSLGVVLGQRGKQVEAETHLREALRIQTSLFPTGNEETVESLNDLGEVLRAAGKLQDAEAVNREALEMVRKIYGGESPEVASGLAKLGYDLMVEGRPAEAEPLVREGYEQRKKFLGVEHKYVASARNALFFILTRQGKLTEAEQLLRTDTAALKTKNPGVELGISLEHLSFVLRIQGSLLEAGAVHREAMKAWADSAEGATSVQMNEIAWSIAVSEEASPAEAQRAVELAEKVVAATHRKDPALLDTLAAALARRGQMGKAAAIQEEAIGLLTDPGQKQDYASRLRLYQANKAYSESGDSLECAKALASYTARLLIEGRPVEAEAAGRRCLAIREREAPDDWSTFASRSLVGATLLGQKKYAEAEPLLESGYEGMKQRGDKIPAQGKVRLRESLERLVQLYEETNRPDKVAECKQKLAELDQTPK
jgi:eukaryotic-like serine/threonine-protein kinase